MVNLAILGCGGAGIKFLSDIECISNILCIGINDVSGNIKITRDKAIMVDSIQDDIAFELYPWLENIAAERIVVLAGLGGIIGTSIAKLVGTVLGKKHEVYGIFAEPFSFESPERGQRCNEAKSVINKTYRAVVYLPNDPLVKYYSNLAMAESMKIHGVVMRHLVHDFEYMVNYASQFGLQGVLGVGIGFGVGRDRIRLAIEDAIDSPWHNGNRRYALFSGNLEREDIEVVVKAYDFEYWDFVRTDEYGEQVKVTVLSR